MKMLSLLGAGRVRPGKKLPLFPVKRLRTVTISPAPFLCFYLKSRNYAEQPQPQPLPLQPLLSVLMFWNLATSGAPRQRGQRGQPNQIINFQRLFIVRIMLAERLNIPQTCPTSGFGIEYYLGIYLKGISCNQKLFNCFEAANFCII